MNPSPLNHPPPSEPAAPEEEGTELPLLHSWRAMYWFVLGSFVVWVVALAMVSRAFS